METIMSAMSSEWDHQYTTKSPGISEDENDDLEGSPKLWICEDEHTESEKDTSEKLAIFSGPKKKPVYRYAAVECPECHKKLAHAGSLMTHMRIHTGEKPYTCEVCNRTFSVKVNYTNHLLTHQGKNFLCDTCGWKGTTKHKLKIHRRKHTDVDLTGKEIEQDNPSGKKKTPYTCDFCNKSVQLYSRFLIHLRTHTGEKAYTCEVCNRGFNVKCNYKRHLLRHKDTKAHACRICNRGFYERRHLVIHMEKLHSATQNRNTDQSLTLVTQTSCASNGSVGVQTSREHTDLVQARHQSDQTSADGHKKPNLHVKTFTCSICNVVFDNRREYKKHSLLHLSADGFVCSVCSKSFKTSRSLKSHQLCHAEEGKYKCSTCSATFKQHQSLWRHQKYHQEVKPHVCPTCQKGFSIKADLTRHMKVHGSKKFKCQGCGQDFESQEKAISHVIPCSLRTGMPWVCEHCNILFKHKKYYMKHKMSGCSGPSIPLVTSATHTEDDPMSSAVESSVFLQDTALLESQSVEVARVVEETMEITQLWETRNLVYITTE